MARQSKKQSLPRSIALGGIFSSCAVIIMLVGGYTPIGTYAAPIFAGICLIPVAIDIGTKWALLCYVAVSAISLFMVPDHELVLFFIVLLGYYPILQPSIQKLKNRVVAYSIKFILFNASIVVVYLILLYLLASPALWAEMRNKAMWFWLILLVMGNVTFFMYDSMLDKLRLIYCQRIQKKLFR